MGSCIGPSHKASVFSKYPQQTPSRLDKSSIKIKDTSEVSEGKNNSPLATKSRFRRMELPKIEEEQVTPRSAFTPRSTIKKTKSVRVFQGETPIRNHNMQVSAVSEILGRSHHESTIPRHQKPKRQQRLFQNYHPHRDTSLYHPNLSSTKISELDIDFHIQPPHFGKLVPMEDATFREEEVPPNKIQLIIMPTRETYFIK